MANRTPPHFLSTRAMAMVLAGDAGASLDPLTRDRAKPAVPFGGRYRIIDFCLSNLVNSGILKLKVLTQYKSNSLNRHISSTWRMTDSLGHYCDTVPAQMRTGQDWYRGSADAIFQNVNLIQDEAPDHVFVFGADHIYQMEVQQMLEAHVLNGADCTVAVVPVPIEEGSRVGVVEVDAEWRVKGFVEKPANPKPLPGDPTRCLASMGNYVFTTDALIREVTADAADENSRHDFGHSILTAMHQRAAVYAYDFFSNVVPGQGAREKGYWRDVGSLDTYYQCNMDLVGVEPVFNLYNDRWPILTAHSALPPAKFVFNDVHHSRVGHATDSLVSEGCIVSGSWVHRSVLAPRVRINSYAEVGESILLDGVRVGRRAIVRRAIIDKHVQVPEGMHIGVDPEEDRRRFTVTPGGVVVIPKGAKLG